MFSIKSDYITVPHESHNTILCVLTSIVHVALGQITAQYQIQISDENTCIHTDRATHFAHLDLVIIASLTLYQFYGCRGYKQSTARMMYLKHL